MNPFRVALGELGAVTDALDLPAVARACETIAGAGRILGHGTGREGLQLAGFILRLHQMGLPAAMQGDLTAPPLGPGDLFLCTAGQGASATLPALMACARQAGARTLYLTARAEGPAAELADQILILPAACLNGDQAGATVLTLGALYEGALFLLFEVMSLDLRDRLAILPDTMRARQGNMG